MKRSLLSVLFICCMICITIKAPAYSDQFMTKKKPARPDTSKGQLFTNSPIRTVEGIVQNVTNDSIEVRGKYYSISGIPLVNPSGEYLKSSFLGTGKKVEIFFREGNIISIVIFDDMLE